MSFSKKQIPEPLPEEPSASGPFLGHGGDADTLYPLAQAAKLFPRWKGQSPVHVSTILRWISKGLKTPGGVVRLAATRAGGRWMVSGAELQRFTERLTRARQAQETAPLPAERRSRRADQAESELRKLGF